MAQTAARKTENVTQPKVQPQQDNSLQRVIAVENQAVPFSKTEKILVVMIGVLTFVCTLALIGLRTDNAQQQKQVQDLSAKMETVQNQNSNLRQEISELNNSSRLLRIAEQHHLSLKNENVRNISK